MESPDVFALPCDAFPLPPTPHAGSTFTDADMAALVEWKEEVRWRGVACWIFGDYGTERGAELAEVAGPGHCTPGWRLWPSTYGGLRLANLMTGTEHRAGAIADLLRIVEAELEVETADASEPRSLLRSVLARLGPATRRSGF